ncbi:uncharacterized protein MELLADRAFT_96070 [Melampsora larici-populina 98AG31]|uniref:Uncharacterized protein n=1 Tax=Melampsora larici-populina (strain 98AG31 / pathotype 3-4-7) TaxID=747676 RepID=F4RU42_MELLP|nr:uncharacterized protein MELLADRAFT_89648 [Melampsora larici-populina 98AG31]XP_007418500.1 uncharacterized protein MELLADRAFT_96070 [Melampsora larici-populina 98AG31]EGF98229.1 hypothetical protein MELLADRAFT_96070 [Melampsora larici-populina 98AG31]EGG04148.1 hypothetical protein MELLADRAFT_89648 [Melampsora larici-populina 98AG31]
MSPIWSSSVYLGMDGGAYYWQSCPNAKIDSLRMVSYHHLIIIVATVGKTMVRAHTQRGFFRNMLTNMSQQDWNNLGLDEFFHTPAAKWRTFSPPSEIIPSIMTTLVTMGHSDTDLAPALQTTSYWKHAGKIYSPREIHQGNSCVQLHNNSQFKFGTIRHIIRLVKDSTLLLIVDSFRPLQGADQLRNPYRHLPHLKADVLYRESPVIQCINLDHLYGHCVVAENPPDTFEIHESTNITVGLRSMAIIDMTSSLAGFGN